MLSPLDLKNKMMEPKKRKYYDKGIDEKEEFLKPDIIDNKWTTQVL